ncbi:hypothetical protein NX059_004512 [Plenodomus lindquistii]|nr:hypothetical protein NX059_004512 [Plenodomus lindquistii]
MFALACERGLFEGSLDDLLDDDQSFLRVNEDIAEQAVFVAADTEGRLVPEKPMGSNALNLKLQGMCVDVGLLNTNTTYSFRREAAAATLMSHGTESAQALLNHVPTSKGAIIPYDHKGLGSRDMTAFRLGGAELAPEEIKKNTSRSPE